LLAPGPDLGGGTGPAWAEPERAKPPLDTFATTLGSALSDEEVRGAYAPKHLPDLEQRREGSNR
jgi:hypothetical protein